MKIFGKIIGISTAFLAGCVVSRMNFNSNPYPGHDEEYNKKFKEWLQHNF